MSLAQEHRGNMQSKNILHGVLLADVVGSRSRAHLRSSLNEKLRIASIAPMGDKLVRKLLIVSVAAKQLLRNLREAVKQLDEHAALMEKQGRKLRGSVCVVNLTDQTLASLRRDESLMRIRRRLYGIHCIRDRPHYGIANRSCRPPPPG
jgi:hypothetical protein